MDIKKKDKHSHSGVSGSPKKGGGGGKGTWGIGGLDDLKATTGSKDPKDPYYDSEEEETKVVLPKAEVVDPVEVIVKEYLSEGDVNDVVNSMKEVKGLSYSQFVRKALILSMERQSYDREVVSQLLSELHHGVKLFESEVIGDGFQKLLRLIDDTKLDVPLAIEYAGKFIARAIVDEVVPPAFIKNTLEDMRDELSASAKEALGIANGLISEHHKLKHIEHIWGAGDLKSVKRLKHEARLIIEEFITSGDYSEADKCIRNLNAPSFHFQIVSLALRKAIEKNEQERNKILDLLAFLHKEALLIPDNISHGFKACASLINDIKLDVPNAPTIFDTIVSAAKTQGWLSHEFK